MPEPSGGGSEQYQSLLFSKPTTIEFSMMMPQLLKDIDSPTAPQIIAKIREAMQQANTAEEHDYWLSPEGQEELKKMNNDRARQ